ncbi:hypothetical protein GCM10022226_33360 [Sphaerisporangium flaviroseum]|uniref:Uncharacterized protein n=1 Tax=Sphaerisporangium flaviroseum TaxID=509199 RepID=A0ABP7I543_9ACTN
MVRREWAPAHPPTPRWPAAQRRRIRRPASRRIGAAPHHPGTGGNPRPRAVDPSLSEHEPVEWFGKELMEWFGENGPRLTRPPPFPAVNGAGFAAPLPAASAPAKGLPGAGWEVPHGTGTTGREPIATRHDRQHGS